MDLFNHSYLKPLLNTMNSFSTTRNGVTRIAYSYEENKAKQLFLDICKNLGMSVKVDEIGNLIVRKEGIDDNAPAIVMGSHLDTVYNGGEYDGIVGVLGALEVLVQLIREKYENKHPIEIIVFACEESTRFNQSTVGSKVLCGEVGPHDLESLKDKDGITLEKALRDNGLALKNIEKARRKRTEVKMFLELHIEQGSILENNQSKIGIVTDISAPYRFELNIKGRSAHSGTTTMEERNDALLAASEISLKLEYLAKLEAERGSVATVGILDVHNGSMNVVPSDVSLKAEIRSISLESRDSIIDKLNIFMQKIIKKRGIQIKCEWAQEERPVSMNKLLIDELNKTCAVLNIPSLKMISGAGHDSMNMAKHWPTGLIFIPSVNGISHHPDEYTRDEDIKNGIKVLKELVLSIDK